MRAAPRFLKGRNGAKCAPVARSICCYTTPPLATRRDARAARFLALGEASAAIDPQLAELRDRGHQNIRSDMHDLATALAAIDPRIDPDRLAETLFAFAANESPYLRLTEECDWPEQQYASAIRAILAALVDHATS
jgi:hypothetical protein